jgi:hypothetical protein
MRRLQAVRLKDSEVHWTILCTANDPDFLTERPVISAAYILWGCIACVRARVETAVSHLRRQKENFFSVFLEWGETEFTWYFGH